jgi:hypothetical protein
MMIGEGFKFCVGSKTAFSHGKDKSLCAFNVEYYTIVHAHDSYTVADV